MSAMTALLGVQRLEGDLRGRAVHLEGGLFGPDLLERLQGHPSPPGQRPQDFGLGGTRSVVAEAADVYRDAKDLWRVFRRRLERLPEDDPATSLTRETFVRPFLVYLGYELHYNPKAFELGGVSYAVSHRAGENEDAPPVHIVGARRDLGRVDPSGRPRISPHALLQEFLNRSEHLWGLVTNGRLLRLLRKSSLLRRQAYVEFDLEAIFEAEGDARFQDFLLLFRLLHRTRLPRGIEDAKECWLERYHQEALEQGNRARDRLRDGVEECLKILGTSFLRSNEGLLYGEDAARSMYADLLRLVYRFLFLLVAEERGLLGGTDLYREHYSVSRLRRLVDRREAYTGHDDLWHSLRVLWHLLRDSTPFPQAGGKPLASLLGLPVLDGGLFEPLPIDELRLPNQDLLRAFRHLVYYYDEEASTERRVNYAALDVEELGSVYESLLDNHPEIVQEREGPAFRFTEGTERKSTGSYYTPPELVQELIKSALEPVIEERLEEARRMANGERRMANGEWRMVGTSWKHVTPRIKERFIHVYRERLSRSGSLEAGNVHRTGGLSSHAELPTERTARDDQPASPSSRLDPSEHRGGMGTPVYGGIHPIPPSSQRKPHGTGNPPDTEQHGGVVPGGSSATPHDPASGSGQTAPYAGTQPPTEEELAIAWSKTPFAIRYSLFAAEAILSIRVLDPACGSGHFLLAAARRLGRELARVETGEEEPSPEALRKAVREVIAHCIYGVDKNPLAVELCKVALWIEGHVPGKPLTFLDHRIRCGDSLVGVFDPKVLKQGIPDEAFEPKSGEEKALAKLIKKRNTEQRSGQGELFVEPLNNALLKSALEALELEAISDDTMDDVTKKARQYETLRRSQSAIRQACNLWTAAFFQTLDLLKPIITSEVLWRALSAQPVHGQVLGMAEALAEQHRFFHWPLEFPEVFEDGGFDVVLSNPPFMGGLKISGTFGPHYRHWLEYAFAPFGGTADLCAAFYRRAFSLLRSGGRMGMVATNTIGQGDTRESGLAPILRNGGTITFARRFIKWPGAANVEVNLVVIHKPDHSPFAIRHSPFLDGHPVPFISSRLDPDPESEPKRLPQNEGKAFIGDYVRGIGFVLEPEEAEALLAKDPRNRDCLFPYLNGEDLNSHPEQKPSRWVICFHDWPLERARQYPDLLRIVEERVKPERERLRGPGDKRNREFWWQFGAYRSAMRQAIAPLRRVLVRSRIAEMHALVFVPKGWIYNEKTIVFAFDDDYHFAVLHSSVHESWMRRFTSTLRTDLNYAPTDCFDTFPFPPDEYRRIANGEWRMDELPEAFRCAAQVGADYHEHRRQIMLARNIGLTKTYNLFHDPACTDADIQRLRELHVEMDNAILACYGWADLSLDHGFYPNDRGQVRFTVSPKARREVIHRLLELNMQVAFRTHM